MSQLHPNVSLHYVGLRRPITSILFHKCIATNVHVSHLSHLLPKLMAPLEEPLLCHKSTDAPVAPVQPKAEVEGLLIPWNSSADGNERHERQQRKVACPRDIRFMALRCHGRSIPLQKMTEIVTWIPIM